MKDKAISGLVGYLSTTIQSSHAIEEKSPRGSIEYEDPDIILVGNQTITNHPYGYNVEGVINKIK